MITQQIKNLHIGRDLSFKIVKYTRKGSNGESKYSVINSIHSLFIRSTESNYLKNHLAKSDTFNWKYITNFTHTHRTRAWDQQEVVCKASPEEARGHTDSSWFLHLVKPSWKDQQVRSKARRGCVTQACSEDTGEASHCTQTYGVNVWKSLLRLESSLIGLPLNNQFCLHCWKEMY